MRNLPAKRTTPLPVPRAPELPAASALAGFLSGNTKRAYTVDILQFFDAADLSEISMGLLVGVTPEQVVAWRDRMMEGGLKPSTVARKLSALRSVYKYLVARGLVKINPAHPDLVRAPKQGTIRKTDYLDKDRVERFLDQPDMKTQLGVRDRAMLLVAVKLGLRRSEICSLQLDDFSTRGSQLTLLLRGKGEKERRLPVPDDVWAAISAWSRCRGKKGAYVFVTKRGVRITEHAFWKNVKRYAKAAGVENVHPHTLRATCIMLLLDRGIPVHVVQQMMGHARGDTTLAYVRELDLAQSGIVDALADVGRGE